MRIIFISLTPHIKSIYKSWRFCLHLFRLCLCYLLIAASWGLSMNPNSLPSFLQSSPCYFHIASIRIFLKYIYYHVTLLLKLLQFLCLVNLMVTFEFQVVAYNKEEVSWTLHIFSFSIFTTFPNTCLSFSPYITFGFFNWPSSTLTDGVNSPA